MTTTPTTMRPVRWTFDTEAFDGFTDDTTWNGWLNVWVTEETHIRVLGTTVRRFGTDKERVARLEKSDGMVDYAIALMEELSDLEQITPDERGLYCYGGGYTAREVK